MKDGEPPQTKPTIVLGIGGKAAKLVQLEHVAKDGVPLLRRFSGGGTVIVDQDSLFVTFIMNTVGRCSR
jgi:lipoate-protein ligase A